MMRRTSQLTRLIWDFYRENQWELQKLKTLEKCQVFRRWGVLHIRCWNQDVANRLVSIHTLIEVPIAKLRIAQKLKISVKKEQVAMFYINSDSDKQFV